MKDFWAEFFKALKDFIPTITAFFVGKRVGELGKAELEAKRDALKLELERFKIRERLREENAGKSDSDIVDGAIREGLDEMSKRE